MKTIFFVLIFLCTVGFLPGAFAQNESKTIIQKTLNFQSIEMFCYPLESKVDKNDEPTCLGYECDHLIQLVIDYFLPEANANCSGIGVRITCCEDGVPVERMILVQPNDLGCYEVIDERKF